MTFTTFTANCQIIRADRQTGYNKFRNDFFRNRELSRMARLVHGYLLSNSDKWHVNLKQAARDLGMCQTTLTKYIQELIDTGRLTRERIRLPNGWFGGYRYTVYEEPLVKPPKPQPEPPESRRNFSITEELCDRKLEVIQNNQTTNNQTNDPDLSPTPQILAEEEIDFCLHSEPEPETIQEYTFVPPKLKEPEPEPEPEPCQTDLDCANQPKKLGTVTAVGEEECSAADYEEVTKVNTKPTYRELCSARRESTWVAFGRENGLWESLEELQGFMKALYTHAVNNPRLHTPSKWVESEVQKTCDRGTGAHWTEYRAGLAVGTIDSKPWRDIYGNINPSFRSYVEQSKFGEAGNSPTRAVELAAQVFSDPFKTGLLWNEYQRRLERELEEKAKCDKLGITYDPPSILKPKSLVSAADTAQTQQILGIDAAAPIYQPTLEPSPAAPVLDGAEVESVAVVEAAVSTAQTQQILGIDAPVPLDPALDPALDCRLPDVAVVVVESAVSVPVVEADEEEPDLGEAPWDKVAADVETQMAVQMAALMGKMGISKQPRVTPLSEIYAEPKPINQTEARAYNAWYDLAKAQGLILYGYGDSEHHAMVVLADGATVLPWRVAQARLKIEPHQNRLL